MVVNTTKINNEMIRYTKNFIFRNPFHPDKISFTLKLYDWAYRKRNKRIADLLLGLPLEKSFNLFYRLYNLMPNSDIGCFMIDGIERKKILFNGKNIQFHSIFAKQYENGYEPETAHLIDLLVGDEGIFYDIGSNWGYFSLYVASRPSFQGIVYAFEPVPSTYLDLISVVKQANLESKIKCYQVALSDKVGIGEMIFPDKVHSGWATLIEKTNPNSKNTVKLITIDELHAPDPDVIKVDAEGSEEKIFIGADKLLTNKKPMLIFESWIYRNEVDKTLRVFDFLKRKGYRFFIPCFLELQSSLRYVHFESIKEKKGLSLAIKSFNLEDRFLLPNRINCLACHEMNIEKLYSIFSESCDESK